MPSSESTPTDDRLSRAVDLATEVLRTRKPDGSYKAQVVLNAIGLDALLDVVDAARSLREALRHTEVWLMDEEETFDVAERALPDWTNSK